MEDLKPTTEVVTPEGVDIDPVNVDIDLRIGEIKAHIALCADVLSSGAALTPDCARTLLGGAVFLLKVIAPLEDELRLDIRALEAIAGTFEQLEGVFRTVKARPWLQRSIPCPEEEER